MNTQVVSGGLSRAFFALLRRDLLLAFRRRTELLFPVIFLAVVVSLFPLGIGPGPQLLARIAPGVIWIAALLATVTTAGPYRARGHLDCRPAGHGNFSGRPVPFRL
jgi:hypothetical protein